MKTLSIETNFKKYILTNCSNLNENRIVRCGPGENPAHLRFKTGCGIESLDEFTKIFTDLELKYTPNNNFTGSPNYQGHGFDIEWQNDRIGVLLAISNTGVERKKYTPQNFKFNGLTFADPVIFRQEIIKQLVIIEKDIDLRKFLISLLDNIEGQGPTSDPKKHQKNINMITSDFGEILCAYQSCLNRHTVEFPSISNNNLFDYYEDKVPVSAKGRKSGGKVNLVNFKDLINKTSKTGKFLYSLAVHNKEDFFKYAAELSPVIEGIKNLVGGVTENQIKAYILKTKYDDFYKIIDTEFYGIGVPLRSKDSRPRALWAAGDTNPFYFTLNTLIHRFWGTTEEAVDLISPIVVKFLQSAKFMHLDIVDNNVVIKQLLFSDVKRWQTVYWSRSTAAWHNWMAVEPVKDT